MKKITRKIFKGKNKGFYTKPADPEERREFLRKQAEKLKKIEGE